MDENRNFLFLGRGINWIKPFFVWKEKIVRRIKF